MRAPNQLYTSYLSKASQYPQSFQGKANLPHRQRSPFGNIAMYTWPIFVTVGSDGDTLKHWLDGAVALGTLILAIVIWWIAGEPKRTAQRLRGEAQSLAVAILMNVDISLRAALRASPQDSRHLLAEFRSEAQRARKSLVRFGGRLEALSPYQIYRLLNFQELMTQAGIKVQEILGAEDPTFAYTAGIPMLSKLADDMSDALHSVITGEVREIPRDPVP